MKRLLLACLALALAPAAAAQTVVHGEWVTLGDVAPVTGEAAKTLLAPAPQPGQTLSLDPKFIVEAARRSNIVLALPLDQPVLVSRAGPSGPIAAPQARQAPVARSAPVAPQAPAAGVSGPPVAGWILVLVHDVARGVKISPADVEWAAPPAGARPRGPDAVDAVVGQEARRLLRAGQPLQSADLKPATVIRKGDPVQLVYASEGLRLTVDGQAQSDAPAGEAVRVLNRYSKRSVDAVATAEGEARVSR